VVENLKRRIEVPTSEGSQQMTHRFRILFRHSPRSISRFGALSMRSSALRPKQHLLVVSAVSGAGVEPISANSEALGFGQRVPGVPRVAPQPL
jgi:hypothetical protein